VVPTNPFESLAANPPLTHAIEEEQVNTGGSTFFFEALLPMTTPNLQPTRTACAIVLSTVITAAIFGLVIVLPTVA